MVLAFSVTTAVLSAFLDNVTTVLLVVPVTFLLADALDIDPIPLIVIEIIASNVGGTATLIGDPPNILIAGHTGLSFGAFIANLAPIVVVTMVVIVPGALPRVPQPTAGDARGPRAPAGPGRARARSRIPHEARRTVPILVLTILAFFLHKALHLEPATVALAGAAVMLLVTRQPMQEAIGGIEWPTLFFLIGLFVLVGSLEETGALGEVADGIASVTGGDRVAELLGILWASAVGSAVVDNIPFTAAMIPVVDQLGGAGDDAYWWALALGACFGGNATIIAAAANVTASGHGRARRRADQLPRLPARSGFPSPLVSLVMSHRLRHAEVRMSREVIDEVVRRDPPLLHVDDPSSRPSRRLLDCALPALPVDRRPRAPRRDLRRARVHRGACSPATSGSSGTPPSCRARSTTSSRSARPVAIEPVGKHMNREHIHVGARELRHPDRRDLPPPPRADHPRRRRPTRSRGSSPATPSSTQRRSDSWAATEVIASATAAAGTRPVWNAPESSCPACSRSSRLSASWPCTRRSRRRRRRPRCWWRPVTGSVCRLPPTASRPSAASGSSRCRFRRVHRLPPMRSASRGSAGSGVRSRTHRSREHRSPGRASTRRQRRCCRGPGR